MNKPPIIEKYLCNIAKEAQRDADYDWHKEQVKQLFQYIEGNYRSLDTKCNFYGIRIENSEWQKLKEEYP